MPRVGVLSLQGDFARHGAMLEALGVTPVRVTLPRDLEDCAALVLPGGESTTMTRLLAATGLRVPLERFVRERPVLGTCAGVILLSTRADRLPEPPLGVLDVAMERNAYGRQLDSFVADVEVEPLGRAFSGVFIRAPRIREVGAGVEVFARRRDPEGRTEPVGIRSGRIVGLCFHPELTRDSALHAWFLSEVAGLPVPGDERASIRSAASAEATR